MSAVDPTLIRHAHVTFDLQPVPQYFKVAYLPDPTNDVDGTIVCMDLYSDAARTKLLADDLRPDEFPPAVLEEIREGLHWELKREAFRAQVRRQHAALVAGVSA